MSKNQAVKVDLPKEQQARSIEQVRKEYAVLVGKTGQLQYQIFTLGKDLELLNSHMRDLNLEAVSISAKQEQQPAATSNE